jgi:dethiobiotin synthetase
MSARVLFVSGTDTGIGKTYASVALIHALRSTQRRVLPMKPVASGCELHDGVRINDDALRLIEACGESVDYGVVNPYALSEPVSPHIAARLEGVRIDTGAIADAARGLAAACDVLVVEGAGGWLSPLDEGLWQSDLVHLLDAEVLLVVGLRLGCISHALLSVRAIAADGCRLSGWIGNRVEPDMRSDDAVIETLTATLGAPCLGVLPWGSAAPSAALDLGVLGY